jgi:hypothetical protein
MHAAITAQPFQVIMSGSLYLLCSLLRAMIVNNTLTALKQPENRLPEKIERWTAQC